MLGAHRGIWSPGGQFVVQFIAEYGFVACTPVADDRAPGIAEDPENVGSNALFAAGVAAVVLGLLGGTTWLTGGFWAPDGVYSRFVWPGIGVVWGMVVSGVLLTRSPATRSGW